MIEVGNIVKNLNPAEAVKITSVKKLGNCFSLSYIGINSNKLGSKILNESQLETLEVLTDTGKFNFKGDPEKFILFSEAERINSAYQFDPLFAINCSVVDPLPHQVEAVYKFLLPQPQIRFLLADDTGAGKTIMTGLLLKEMILRKQIERILIITPGGLTKQWQEDEMGIKFNIPFTLANRASYNAEPTIFQNHDHVIASIDFVCREDIQNVLSKTNWDMIIFDEAHKLSAYEYGEKIYKSRRYEVAHMLSKQCEHLLLLTATPHRGRQDTFKRLLQLLDEDIFATADIAAARVKEYSQDGANKFFIRRLKEDMRDWFGNPLYKARFTRTVSYQLTPEEKRLYDAVTTYLTVRKKEASETKNIHVSLALQVMQRRLVSSIFAIKNTLFKRWQALQQLADMLQKNPSLWSQRQNVQDVDISNIDQWDELDDDERDDLDNIMSDPKKLKLFTTSKSPKQIAEEAAEVKALYEMANALYTSNTEEKKYQELKELLRSQNVLGGEKLVIFTEHKDTLLYLQERLSNTGYAVATIHGGMSVDERRASQCEFMTDKAQILICTDAAGEGINLQFCRLLINWDIPWNPNRLEQRMGRIHRYGQKEDVLVFNMVADNTREGKVLKTLLTKLDVIREQLGDDRVYDVIQDVFKGIALDSIIDCVFNGKDTDLSEFIDKEATDLEGIFKRSIDENRNALAHTTVNYDTAVLLKDESDERRLQPIYIRQFFERAFKFLGGEFEEVQPGIYHVNHIPEVLAQRMKDDYNIYADNVQHLLFVFDKHIFLDYRAQNPLSGRAHYINPGNPLFDCLINVVRDSFRDEMLKGSVLVSPDDTDSYFAFFVKNQIVDNRLSKDSENVVAERLTLILQNASGEFRMTSPAKLIDLVPPSALAKEVTPPEVTSEEDVMQWAFEFITTPLLEETYQATQADAERRLEYVEQAFTNVLVDMQAEISELQGKTLFQDNERLQQKLQNKMARYNDLLKRRAQRLKEMEKMVEVNPREPEVLGCAFVVPLSQMEYTNATGMHRDDEVEAIAMKVATDYEVSHGRTVTDVSADNVGYDLRSVDSDGEKRYIEVKGRSGTDGVMLSSNEMFRLAQLGKRAWLYIVSDCKSEPKLKTINDPANVLEFEKLIKGVQYFLPKEHWQAHQE